MYFQDVMQTNLSAAGVASGELERINAEAADAQYNAAEAAELFRRMEAVVQKEVNKAAAMADEIKACEYQVRPDDESNTQPRLWNTRGLNSMEECDWATHWRSPDRYPTAVLA